MTLFEFSQFFIFFLITLTVVTGGLTIIFLIDGLIVIITNRIKNKEAFDKRYQVGSIFITKIKQEFPYGEWKYIGKDQHGFYLYERTK